MKVLNTSWRTTGILKMKGSKWKFYHRQCSNISLVNKTDIWNVGLTQCRNGLFTFQRKHYLVCSERKFYCNNVYYLTSKNAINSSCWRAFHSVSTFPQESQKDHAERYTNEHVNCEKPIVKSNGKSHKDKFMQANDENHVCVFVTASGGLNFPKQVVFSSRFHGSLFFNFGENSKRFNLHNDISRRIQGIFLTGNSLQHINGITPFSVLDTKLNRDFVIQGPSIMDKWLDKAFNMSDQLRLCKQSLDGSTVNFNSEYPLRVDHVVSYPTRDGIRHKDEDKIAVAYILEQKKEFQPGIRYLQCVDYNISNPEDVIKLRDASDIFTPLLLSNGDYVRPADILNFIISKKVIVLECPSEYHIDDLMTSEKLRDSQVPHKSSSDMVAVVVHITPLEVVQTPRYRQFIESFGEETGHILLHSDVNPSMSEAVYEVYGRLNILNRKIFPPLLPNVTFTSMDKFCLPKNTFHGYFGMQYDFSHSLNNQRFERPDYFRNVQEKLQKSKEVQSSLKAHFSRCNKLTDDEKQQVYPELCFLGTSNSYNPHRNQAGINIQISKDKAILLDCGEGIYFQFYQAYGSETDNMLRKLKALFISHYHGDHFNGMFTLIQKRKEAFEKAELTYEPLWLLLPRPSKQVKSDIEEMEILYSISPNFVRKLFLPSLLSSSQSTTEIKEFLEAVGLEKFKPVRVIHCYESYGVVMITKNKKKIAYSGDCKPTKQLVKSGYKCDILIHEATYPDHMSANSQHSVHSTYLEAVDVSKKMQAKMALLTHFIDYCHVADEHTNVFSAFDFMRVNTDDIHRLKEVKQGLKVVCRDQIHAFNLHKYQKEKMKNDSYLEYIE